MWRPQWRILQEEGLAPPPEEEGQGAGEGQGQQQGEEGGEAAAAAGPQGGGGGEGWVEVREAGLRLFASPQVGRCSYAWCLVIHDAWCLHDVA